MRLKGENDVICSVALLEFARPALRAGARFIATHGARDTVRALIS